jgi:Na+/proline symporter
VQRYYAASSDQEARWVGYTVAFFTVIGPPILFWPAIAATQFLPGVADANSIYPMICRLLLPAGLMGVVVAAMFSATMSMLSSDYNALSSVITNDIIKRLFVPDASDRALVFIARASTFAVGGVAMAFAVVLVYQEDLEDLVKYMAQLFAVLLPPVALPMAAGLLNNKVSERGALAGFALGSFCGIAAYVIGGGEALGWLRTVQWLTWISILPTLLGLAVGSLLWPDSPAKREQVDAFLSGLIDRAPQAKRKARGRDGLYAMYIIGMTAVALGVLMIAAVALTAPIREGWLTISVGAVFAVGGGLAAWRARRHVGGLET